MVYKVDRVVIIGAGVMGAGIAAHLANCGIHVLLLDQLPSELTVKDKEMGFCENSPEWRNKIAQMSLNGLLSSKRPVFSSEASYKRISIGNIQDDLDKIGDFDWIIETIIENLEIKKQLFASIERFRKRGTIVSTNTSGLPISQINSEFSEELKQHFLGTHFFNPPTYAKLMEIIPGTNTLPAIVDFMVRFCREQLDKRPLVVKDTPNFIANRLAIVTTINVFHLCQQRGIRVEEADVLCGKVMGRMQTAVFGTADAVGLDTVANVTLNIRENAKNDERRDLFILPGFVDKMLENNWLGDKTRGGFYKRQKQTSGESKKLVLDLNTVQYRELIEPDFPCLRAAAQVDNLGEKVRTLIEGDDPGALFAWEVLANDLIYAANRVLEIADTIIDIDNAMKSGYYWRLGPFECWDAIGVRPSVERMKKEGKKVPTRVEIMLDKGYEGFYSYQEGVKYYFDFRSNSYQAV